MLQMRQTRDFNGTLIVLKIYFAYYLVVVLGNSKILSMILFSPNNTIIISCQNIHVIQK